MSSKQRTKKEIAQELLYTKELQNQIIKQYELLKSLHENLITVSEFIEYMKAVKEPSNILVPLAGLGYVSAKIENINEILIRVNGKILIPCTPEKALEILNKRKKQIEESLEYAEMLIGKFSDRLKSLSKEYQEAKG